MTISVDGSSPAAVRDSNATTSTASFSPPSNALLVAFVHGDVGDGSTDEQCTVTSTGGLSWSRDRLANGSPGATVEIWHAATTTAPGSITVSVTDNKGSTPKSLFVRVFTSSLGGAPTVGQTAAGLDANTLSYTAAANNSWGWYVGFALGGAVTAASGCTVQDSVTDNSFDSGDSLNTISRTTADGTAASTTTVGSTGSGSGHSAVVEILDAAVVGSQIVQAAQAFPPFKTPFREPNAVPFQLLGDTAGITQIALTDSGAGADSLAVVVTDGVQALPPPFPPFTAPWVDPSYIPLQLQGDRSGQQSVTLTDTGAGDDSSLTIAAAVPLTDTGSGADTISVAASVALTDTGAGDDSSLTIAAAVPLTDSGAGADSISVNTGVDPNQALPQFAPMFLEPNYGAFQLLGDSSGIPQISLTDTGTGTDGLTVTAAVPLSDTGGGADTVTVTATTALADTAAGADSVTVAAAVPLTDTAAGSDAVTTTAAVALADTGTASDTLAVTILDQGATAGPQMPPPFGPPFAIRWIIPFQQQGDSTPILITTVPPYTVTATDQPTATITAATSSVSVTGTDRALATVTATSL